MNRNRQTNDEISRRHGHIQVKLLRRIYGTAFAPGLLPTARLSGALAMLDDRSLTMLLEDHEAGTLEGKVAASGLVENEPGACEPKAGYAVEAFETSGRFRKPAH